jgi:hypothetical protein
VLVCDVAPGMSVQVPLMFSCHWYVIVAIGSSTSPRAVSSWPSWATPLTDAGVVTNEILSA